MWAVLLRSWLDVKPLTIFAPAYSVLRMHAKYLVDLRTCFDKIRHIGEVTPTMKPLTDNGALRATSESLSTRKNQFDIKHLFEDNMWEGVGSERATKIPCTKICARSPTAYLPCVARLDSFVLARFSPHAPRYNSRKARCTALRSS